MTKVSQPNPVFLSEAGYELKRITWPKRDQAVKATFLVLAIVFVSTCYVGVIDAVLTKTFFLLKGIN